MTGDRPGKPAAFAAQLAAAAMRCAHRRCRRAYRQLNTMLEGR
ncbi:MAG TPA: hypothetical protein VNW50_03650 [Streptosporangiaceae bacterium]|nr:hypothetical protein [Streptosporangiaceae bacterium]